MSEFPIQSELTPILEALRIQTPPQVPLFVLGRVAVLSYEGEQIYPKHVLNYPPNFQSNIHGGTRITNPGVANTVLADTGPLAQAQYDLFWLITFTAIVAGGGMIVLQRRNPANNANIWQMPIGSFPTTGNTTASTFSEHLSLGISDQERLRIVALEDYSGSAAGTLFIRRRPELATRRG